MSFNSHNTHQNTKRQSLILCSEKQNNWQTIIYFWWLYCWTQMSFNTFGADWRIYGSYVQMHRVRNDAYMRHWIKYTRCGLTYINAKAITFCVLVCLQRHFPQMLFISRHANPEISYKLTKNVVSYEVWYQTILLGLGYKTFSKKLGANSCLVTHNKIFCTRSVAMKIYKNVFHTYAHNSWKYQVISAWTFLVMQFGSQQQFAPE